MQDTRALIKAVLRAIGGLDAGQEPSPTQANDCLETVNATLKGMFGREIGLKLDTVNLTGATAGQPWSWYQCALAAGATLTLPANPQEGWRFGYSDTKANFNTNNLTVNPNGRLIAGAAANLVVSVASATATYFYRGDTGWTAEAELALTDTLPFPVDMHGFLASIVAVDHYPQFWPGQQPDAMLVGLSQKGRESFAARYNGRAQSQRVRQLTQAAN